MPCRIPQRSALRGARCARRAIVVVTAIVVPPAPRPAGPGSGPEATGPASLLGCPGGVAVPVLARHVGVLGGAVGLAGDGLDHLLIGQALACGFCVAAGLAHRDDSSVERSLSSRPSPSRAAGKPAGSPAAPGESWNHTRLPPSWSSAPHRSAISA